MTAPAELVYIVGQEIIRRCPDCTVFVIESTPLNATLMYAHHGYLGMPWTLIDTDKLDDFYVSQIEDPYFPELILPRPVQDAVLVSIAMMKEHSLFVYTGAMKNLFGLPPIKPYSSDGIHKDKFHSPDRKASIVAINKHKPIDLAIIDGSIGGRRNEFDGEAANPPIGKIVAGTDALEADRAAALLLGIFPDEVPHLRRM